MRITSINQQSFKGLWEAKAKDFNDGGLGYVWDILYVYHPFKNENIAGREESLKTQVPETFIHQPDPELLRTMYCTNFCLGNQLEITEDEFLSDKDTILKSLPENFAENAEDLHAEKLFNFNTRSEELLAAEAAAKKMEKKNPGIGKKLLDDVMEN